MRVSQARNRQGLFVGNEPDQQMLGRILELHQAGLRKRAIAESLGLTYDQVRGRFAMAGLVGHKNAGWVHKQDLREAVLDSVLAGYSPVETARRLGIGRCAAYYHERRLGVPSRRLGAAREAWVRERKGARQGPLCLELAPPRPPTPGIARLRGRQGG